MPTWCFLHLHFNVSRGLYVALKQYSLIPKRRKGLTLSRLYRFLVHASTTKFSTAGAIVTCLVTAKKNDCHFWDNLLRTSTSAGDRASFIPFPPPPMTALTSSGKPICAASACNLHAQQQCSFAEASQNFNPQGWQQSKIKEIMSCPPIHALIFAVIAWNNSNSCNRHDFLGLLLVTCVFV